jgi:hypothetical protein
VPAKKSYQPSLEALEARYALTTARLAHGVLQVIGTPKADVINVRLAGSAIKVSGVRAPFSAQAVDKIAVKALAGNDRISIDTKLTIPARIDAGAGNDVVLGGGGDDVIIGGKGKNRLDGRGGRDTTNGVLEARVDIAPAPTPVVAPAPVVVPPPVLPARTPTPPATNPPVGPGLGLVDDGLPGNMVAGKPAQKGAGDRLAADYNDIKQGQSGTCFFGAALSALAQSGVDLASRIKHLGGDAYEVSMFKPIMRGSKGEGFYGADRFDPIKVRVQFSGAASAEALQPNKTEGDFWTTLYYEAYFSPNGPASHPAGGGTGYALMALTGKKNLPSPEDDGAIFGGNAPTDGAADMQAISNALKTKHAVVAGTFQGDGAKRIVEPSTGIVANHAYTVVGIVYSPGATNPYVILRNPWGQDADPDQKGKVTDNMANAKPTSHYTNQSNFDDGLIRIRWNTFAAVFQQYVVAA